MSGTAGDIVRISRWTRQFSAVLGVILDQQTRGLSTDGARKKGAVVDASADTTNAARVSSARRLSAAAHGFDDAL